jgi:phthalate 4,5-dioxygenase
MPLTKERNELLCLVDNGAPMGELLKENFWVPALLSLRIVPDGPPEAVRLFGRNFVAFRSTDGRVGFFDELCPHRGVSLLLARNEDNALRCIFHGWKYDVSGRTVEVPTEPRNHDAFCQTVPLKHYPAREAAGIVWVWLGKGQPKKFPNFEFMNLPPEQVYCVKQIAEYNWVQDVEGTMDSAHVSMLHKSWSAGTPMVAIGDDTAPIYEFEDRPTGFRYAAIRNTKAGGKYIRINEFALPWYGFICPAGSEDGDRQVIMSAPIDDMHVIHWELKYNTQRPLHPSFQNPAEDRNNFPPGVKGGRENRWGQDRGEMQRGHFTGFFHVNTEDFAVATSQGPIVDRTVEYLNSGDLAVVRVRKMLLDLVDASIAKGGLNVFPDDAFAWEDVRAHVQFADSAANWRTAGE